MSSAALDPHGLAGTTVVDVTGRRAGTVRDVYFADRTGDLVAVVVSVGRLVRRDVVVPASHLRPAGSGRTGMDLDRLDLARQPEAPLTGHLTEEALGALQ